MFIMYRTQMVQSFNHNVLTFLTIAYDALLLTFDIIWNIYIWKLLN